MVKNLVEKTVSAKLVDRIKADNNDLDGTDEAITELKEYEKQYDWNRNKDYFKDEVHPSRLPFNANLDYRRDNNGKFLDEIVQTQYRRIQIANQMHTCCFTCWKYCKDCICRFNFPFTQGDNNDEHDSVI